MADVTISELAEVVGVSVDKLLSQIKEAGLPHTKADELISNDDKNTLLVFLRRSHGDREATAAAPKKITLKRKTLGTLKSASTSGRGKTVNVEVRKKRTYVKRSAMDVPPPEEEVITPPEEEQLPTEKVTAEASEPTEAPAVEEVTAAEETTEAKAETPAQEAPPPEADPSRAKAAPRRKKAAGEDDQGDKEKNSPAK